MSLIDEVDLSVLMQMVKDKLDSSEDRAWFIQVRLSAREWAKLVDCYFENVKKVGCEKE